MHSARVRIVDGCAADGFAGELGISLCLLHSPAIWPFEIATSCRVVQGHPSTPQMSTPARGNWFHARCNLDSESFGYPVSGIEIGIE
jgi:hypothetical protein